MKRFILALSLTLITGQLWATDCKETDTNLSALTAVSNFDELMMISDNLTNKMGAPKKGFYLIVESSCKYPLSVAIALASWGKKTDLLSAAFHEPLYVHGWWTIEANGYLKQFFERRITENFFFFFHTQTGLVWGKDNIQYTIQGPDGAKVYPFIEYKSADKCKTEADGVVSCRVKYTCK